MATNNHILLAEPGAAAAVSLAATFRATFRVTCAETGPEAVEVLSQERPDGALIDMKLPALPSLEVADYALARNVPVVMLASSDDLARLEEAGCPYVLKPVPEAALIATARFLMQHATENIARVKAARARLRTTREQATAVRERLGKTREEVAGLIARARATEARAHSDRGERLRKSGLSPRAARGPSLLDDWDVVRAAQHMIEMHADRAIATAEFRAEQASDINVAKRWRAIARTIAEIRGSRD